jgi:hypothetical protein
MTKLTEDVADAYGHGQRENSADVDGWTRGADCDFDWPFATAKIDFFGDYSRRRGPGLLGSCIPRTVKVSFLTALSFEPNWGR